MSCSPCTARSGRRLLALSSFFVLLSVGALPSLTAQTYWVSSTRGRDTNPGTAERPFLSITKGIQTASADGLVLVEPGTYSATQTLEVFPLRIPANKAGLVVRGRSRHGSVRIELGGTVASAAVLEADRARLTALQFRTSATSRIRIGSAAAEVRGARLDGCRLVGPVIVELPHDVRNASVDNNLLLDGASISDQHAQSSVFIEHNTIASTRVFSTAGIRSDGLGSRVTNNLITKRAVGVRTGQAGQAGVRFVGNNVFDCATPWSGISAPAGNFGLPPFFVDPSQGNYRLQGTSALIGRGSSRARNEADAAAFPRALDGNGNGQLRPDIGCFEFGGPELLTGVSDNRLGVSIEAPRAFGALLVGDSEGFLRVDPLPTLLIGLSGSFPFSVGIMTPFRGEFQLPALPADVRLMLQAYVARLPLPTATNRSEARSRPVGSVKEVFTSDAQLDKDASSGNWTAGIASPGRLGGSGRHGAFSLSLGRDVGGGIYEFNTDGLIIPANRTRTGKAETIRDGQFEFTDFRVPFNATVRFVGSKAPVIRACGLVEVLGRVDVNAQSVPSFNPNGNAGQQPVRPGAGGASGGAGGDPGNGQGQRPEYFGKAGADVQLSAGHVYAQRAIRTGGRGAVPFPLDCRNSSVNFRGAFNIFSDMVASGGGGGGFGTAGGIGRVIRTISGQLGQQTPGGVVFDALPIPSGVSHLEHFLIGGSGGGGGATHPAGSSTGAIRWKSGAAGGSGGGALALRSGRGISVGRSGSIEARGGSGVEYRSQAMLPGVGGGGSGGSVVMQTAGTFNQGGLLDVRGGPGQRIRTSTAFLMEVDGGDGAGGFVRIETPNPSSVSIGTVMPAANRARSVGSLTDRDAVVSQQSKWYRVGNGRPLYLRYEVDAMVNNALVRFSDDPRRGVLAGPGAHVEFFVQGADLDASGQPTDTTGWLRRVGKHASEPSLADDAKAAFRFALQFDTSSVQSLDVRRVEVFFTDVR